MKQTMGNYCVFMFLIHSLEMGLGTKRSTTPLAFLVVMEKRNILLRSTNFTLESLRDFSNLHPLSINFKEDTVQLFGIQWVADYTLVDSPLELFHLLKEQLRNLETLFQASCGFGKVSVLQSRQC